MPLLIILKLVKKKIIFAAAAVFMAASVSVFTYISSERNTMDGLFNANVEALAISESGYQCPNACLTWTGSMGGGIDCMCERYVGRCKRWCD